MFPKMRGRQGKRASASKMLQVDPVAASDSGSLQSGSGSQCVEIAASSTGADAYKLVVHGLLKQRHRYQTLRRP